MTTYSKRCSICGRYPAVPYPQKNKIRSYECLRCYNKRKGGKL